MLTLTGCTLRRPVSVEPEFDLATPNRDDRREEVLDEYQQQRTEAMFQAAVGDWRRGDTEKCHDLLQQLLKERPDHRDAQLLLADLYLSQSDLPAAQATIDELLAQRPDDVEALNAKALVLEMLDLPEDAQRTRQRAEQTELRATSLNSSQPQP